MIILTSFNHPHVLSNLYEFFSSSVEHKRRYFKKVFCPYSEIQWGPILFRPERSSKYTLFYRRKKVTQVWINMIIFGWTTICRMCVLDLMGFIFLYMIMTCDPGPQGPCTKMKFPMHFFVFVILSYQNACYGCENAENRTWSGFFFFLYGHVSEAVCKRDWHNVRSYLFFNVQKFRMRISDSVCFRDL